MQKCFCLHPQTTELNCTEKDILHFQTAAWFSINNISHRLSCKLFSLEPFLQKKHQSSNKMCRQPALRIMQTDEDTDSARCNWIFFKNFSMQAWQPKLHSHLTSVYVWDTYLKTSANTSWRQPWFTNTKQHSGFWTIMLAFIQPFTPEDYSFWWHFVSAWSEGRCNFLTTTINLDLSEPVTLYILIIPLLQL